MSKINWSKRSDSPNDMLCVTERLAYASGNAGSCWTYILIAGFLTFYYTNVIGLDPGKIGTIMAISKVFDGISDLLMGIIVDKTRTKWGKCRPWLMIMAIPHVFATMLAFSVPAGLTEAHKYIYVFATYNLVNTITYTATQVPVYTLNSLTTNRSEERAKSGIWMQIGAYSVIFIVNASFLKLIAAFGNDSRAWTIVSTLFGVIGASMMFFCALGTRERVSIQPEETQIPLSKRLKGVFTNGYWWIYVSSSCLGALAQGIITTGALYYCATVLGDSNKYSVASSAQSIATFAALIVLMSWMVKKFGNVTVRQMSFVLFMIPALILFVSNSWSVVMVCFILFGLATACFTGSMGALTADTCEYGGRKAGFDVSGVTNSAQTFISKIGSGLGASILTWGLDFFGYDGTAAVQTERALSGLKITFCILPAVICVAAFLIMTRFDMYKKGHIQEGGRA